MSTAAVPPILLDPATIRARVERLLYDFLDDQEQGAPDLPELALFTGKLRAMLAAGGKRVRPVLCLVGWHSITDRTPPPAVWRVAASLELFHTFALIHDDIMDNSDTRRGQTTAHRALATQHAGRRDADSLGVNTAILLGNLAFGWSYELLHADDVTPAQNRRTRPLLNALRTEALVGQYLDLAAAGKPDADPHIAWRIIRYKTAKYTVERPLTLGATLASATDQQLNALSAYALPLGEAFQLRDDLLGIWGNPAETGKSTLDDLREGKHTVLYALALQRATIPQQRSLHRAFGQPHLTETDAEDIRSVLTASGARTTTEQMITDRREQALAALHTADFRPTGPIWLRHLAHTLTTRSGLSLTDTNEGTVGTGELPSRPDTPRAPTEKTSPGPGV
ncbi:polyprenyl synthetase family protein [Streptomyces sp. DSM 40750]|uniref:polyprenyl synthetase family protein n=1 Tax=Streptomyces sp. DSM 40750 TaxID=2801030 RepID=UPI00214B6143|nr:polyprenyl synthetase family protein [Streptomyces sp. DSM 40750]UUU18878.1 polyprenyl synthetase family protein [Streptomyces sp. DSM 40750]UUU27780.1 polyprenyl synthetase family protein [Streptomyces sp. DSM 40750]